MAILEVMIEVLDYSRYSRDVDKGCLLKLNGVVYRSCSNLPNTVRSIRYWSFRAALTKPSYTHRFRCPFLPRSSESLCVLDFQASNSRAQCNLRPDSIARWRPNCSPIAAYMDRNERAYLEGTVLHYLHKLSSNGQFEIQIALTNSILPRMIVMRINSLTIPLILSFPLSYTLKATTQQLGRINHTTSPTAACISHNASSASQFRSG